MPLTSDINKKDMTEEDIKNRFVTPALNQAGWENELILMEKYFRLFVHNCGWISAA